MLNKWTDGSSSEYIETEYSETESTESSEYITTHRSASPYYIVQNVDISDFEAFGREGRRVLGYGCSRMAIRLDDGQICKVPLIGSRYESAGSSSHKAVYNMVDEIKAEYFDINIAVFMEKSKQITVPESSFSIFAEYVMSRYLELFHSELMRFYALCHSLEFHTVELNGNEVLKVLGLYDNANYLEYPDNDNYTIPYKFGNYSISDLHGGNYVNGRIVDYAMIKK